MRSLNLIRFGLHRVVFSPRRGCATAKSDEDANGTPQEEPWKNPYEQAVPGQSITYSDFREVKVDWDYVRRLLPRTVMPEVQHPGGSVTPSGWRAPKETPPDLPYYIRRGPNNMPEIYLERRRDELNPKTMDFEYVELVVLKNIHGDVFACEQDLRSYLEKYLGHPIATNIDEFKGMIKIKGADRTLVEQFVYDYEEEFMLCANRESGAAAV